MKYLLFCFLLITGCKSALKNTGAPGEALGIAQNTEAGAVITSNGKVYLMTYLPSWDSIYLGKEIEIKGNFTKRSINKTNPGGYYYVSGGTWQLYSPSEVIGIAENTNAGAIVARNDTAYLIPGLQLWDNSYLGKQVKLECRFTLPDKKDSEKNRPPLTDTIKSQRYSEYYSVSQPVWKLYTPDIVTGITENNKGGAVLRSNDKAYYIANLHKWDSIYLGKTVRVKGSFSFINPEVYRVNHANPFLNSLQAQIPSGSYYLVIDATWELCDAN